MTVKEARNAGLIIEVEADVYMLEANNTVLKYDRYWGRRGTSCRWVTEDGEAFTGFDSAYTHSKFLYEYI